MACRASLLVLVAAGCGDPLHVPCGDGDLDPIAEECDDGNLVSGDGCSRNCVREPRCGDLVIDIGENCDDGNTVGGDNCSATCLVETVCGDGDIEPGEACEDGNTDPSDGCSETCEQEFRVGWMATWAFASATDLATDLGCPAGFDTVEIHAQPLRADDTPIGTPTVERFACGLGEAEMPPRFQGRYRARATAMSADGTQVYGAPIVDVLDLRTGQEDLDARFVADGGHAGIGWRLVDGDGQPLLCGNTEVAVLATAPGFARVRFVPCTLGYARTLALVAGDYTVTLTLYDGNGNELAVASRAARVEAPNSFVELGTLPIVVTR